jgi:Bax protein
MNNTLIKTFSIFLITALTLLTFCNTKKADKPQKVLDHEIEIKLIKRKITTYKDIEPITDSLVRPIDYLNVISLKGLSVKEKKQRFVDLILPAILIAKEEYRERLNWVNLVDAKDSLTAHETKLLGDLMKKYHATNVSDLKLRLKTHPVSIVLAQASIESGWGTSRFFTKANNVFGVWSFDPNDPRIPSLSTRWGKHMYLYKYNSLSQSVDDYFKLLATRRPFEQFRKMRLKTDDPYKLVNYLKDYSEKGEEYVQLLKSQIKHNNFTRYDHYVIDPKYFVK